MSTMHKVKAFFGFVEEEDSVPEVKILSSDAPLQSKLRPSAPLSQPSRGGSFFEIRVEEPRVYEDSLNTASALRDGLPVILNLKHLDQQAQKRFIDFMCGTAFAVGGKMLRIGEHIFLFTPPNVTVDSGEKAPIEKPQQSEERDFFTRHSA